METTPVVSIDLKEHGLPITLGLDSNNSELSIVWNDTFGRLELSNDAGLEVFVMEDTLSCASKSLEIEATIFTVNYHTKTDEILAYETSLPDGSAAYHHVFASMNIGGTNYTFENNPLVSYSREQVEEMLKWISSAKESTTEIL